MDAVYYLSVILLVIGLPVFLILIISALIKPRLTHKFSKHQWSRKRIGILGVTSLFVGIIGLSIIINATMPASVRAEIDAQQKADAEAEARQIESEQAAEKSRQEKEALANKPVTKTESIKSPISFTSSVKDDAALPKGQRKTMTVGIDGEKVDTYEIIYIRGVQTAKNLVKSETIKKPVNEVISVGTYVVPVAPQITAPTPTYIAPTPSQSTSVYYANCSAVRAAGVAPIYEGQSGYRPALDRDRDGIACE